MVTQHVTTSSIPSQVSSVIQTEVGLFDDYICFYTGDNTIICLIRAPYSTDCKLLTFTRQSGGYSNIWSLSRSTSTFDYTVSNEVYVYSNQHVGSDLFVSSRADLVCGSLVFVIILLLIWKGFGLLRKVGKRRRSLSYD